MQVTIKHNFLQLFPQLAPQLAHFEHFDLHTHQDEIPANTFAIRNIIIGKGKIPTEKFCSIGIHPWYIEENALEKQFDLIETMALGKNILAIGEIGLDKLVKNASFDLQIAVFKRQIAIAESVEKPIIIHSVRAYNEVVQIKKAMNVKVPMIIHGFNQKLSVATELIQHGFYLSFGAALLNEQSNARKVIQNIPFNRVFLETDDKVISMDLLEELL